VIKLDGLKAVIIALGALAAVVALAGVLLVVQPQRAKISKLDAEIGTNQAELAGLSAGGTKRPSIRAAELFQLSRAMPDTPDVPGMLLDLARLADQSGVKLVSVQPSTPTVLSDGSTALPLNVIVQGSWSTITNFLRNTRQQVQMHGTNVTVGGRLFTVDSVQISAPQTKQSGSAIQGQLILNAFVYGTASVPAATSGTSTTSTSTTTTTTSSSGSQQAAGAPAGGGS
jgi:Tfp pilus assembly protein PilO